jgi:uncharacterized protein (TIGR00369 family)
LTAGEEKLTRFVHKAQNRCFGCGPANETGLHLEFEIDQDGTVISLAEITDRFEGHPGYLHGGIIATLLDEAMSKAVRAQNVSAMTRELKVDYLRPVPSLKPIRIEGRVVKHEDRKYWAEAAIFDGHRTRLAQGSGLFIQIKPKTS